jgi:Type I phosphodiesterase / nucleotide pyrophosphatase
VHEEEITLPSRLKTGALALAFSALTPTGLGAQKFVNSNGVQQVLLISIDGMHALDYQNCVAAGTCPNLAALGATGIVYTRASASMPSDSFPGLSNLITGGTPRSHGVFYDVAYDRVLAPPTNTTRNGLAGGACTAGQPNGTTTEFDDGIDLNPTLLNGGAPGAGLTEGGVNSIDSTRLERNPFNSCQPVFPWNFIRTNTIFGVIHEHGGYTAWSDKHPSYAIVSGPGTGKLVNDFYAPESKSKVVALPGVTTATGVSCAMIVDGTQTASWTDSFQNIQCYDTLKVNAIINEIDGKNHQGTQATQVPTLFGMSFLAVGVGGKLVEKNVGTGGYLDAAGTPTAFLQNEIQFVDAAVGQMVAELNRQSLSDSTLIVIAARHGQSPVDPNRFFPIPGATGGNGESPANWIAAYLPYSESPLNPKGIGPTETDISLLWLANPADTSNAAALLEANAKGAGIGEIFYGPSLTTMFNAPGLPASGGDSRTPDIIVSPNVGVVYTKASTEVALHGGFAHDDTNTMLLLSKPSFKAATVNTAVETAQVAPTILQALGIATTKLQAVLMEGTAVLPGTPLK